MPKASKPKLTPKEEAFALKYVECGNASEAYRHAYDVGENTKPETVWVKAAECLANGKVAERVIQLQEELKERTIVSVERTLEELSRIGFSDVRKVLTSTGHLASPGDWDDETAASIASIEVVTSSTGEKDDEGRPVVEHVHKVKMWDKNSALEKIGKHLAMYVDRSKVEHDVSDALAERLNRAKGRKK